MSFETELLGTVTWDGSLTVLMTDTSQVAVDDYIKRNIESADLKIATVNADVSVVLVNPDSHPIPGTVPSPVVGGFRDDSAIAHLIMSAGDVVKSTPSEETITEPGAPPGTKRPLTTEWVSATVYPGKKVQEVRTYNDGVDKKSWCSCRIIDYSVVPV